MPLTLTPAKDSIRRAFDQAAPAYDTVADVQREIADHLAQMLQEVEIGSTDDRLRILDAGCGTGYGTGLLARRWPDAQYLLVDFSPQMLDSALRQCPVDAQTLCADIEMLPMPDGALDLYWSSLTWQWNDPARCLVEAARVLKLGGILSIATLGAQNFWEVRHAFETVDEATHTLQLPTANQWLSHCQDRGWILFLWQERMIRRHFPDVRTLFRSIKSAGAHHLPQRRTTLLSRKAWQTITERYEALREPEGLPLTYDAIWFVAIRA